MFTTLGRNHVNLFGQCSVRLHSVLQVDQTAFALDKRCFRLEPRKSTTITVSLRTEARAAGKLMEALTEAETLECPEASSLSSLSQRATPTIT